MEKGFRLMQPDQSHEAIYTDLISAWKRSAHRVPRLLPDTDNYGTVLLEFSKHRNAELPYTTYMLMDGDTPLGVVALRHKLDTFLQEFGGHLSFSIRPDQRDRALEEQIIALSIKAARQDLHLPTLIITCSAGNQLLQQAIENNGGKLASRNEREGIEYATYRITI